MKLRKFKFFYPERPRLIHIDQPLLEELSQKREWVAEKKYNGKRLEFHSLPDGFEFWNRHNEKMDYQPGQETQAALQGLPGYCILDGELRDSKVAGVKDKIMFYDVFVWNGELLIGQPFWYRRNLLKKIFQCNAEPVGITEQFAGDFRELFHDVIEDPEIEGLVLKNTRGVLNLGRTGAHDSNWMFKVRRPNNSYRF